MEQEQLNLFPDNPAYEAFVEKFKPKKTTDDCYTPPGIFDVILDYVCKRWNVRAENVVRPFWPGGDYKRFDYKPGAAVVDNPPFSRLAEIVRFYLGASTPFFLFCPSLTAFVCGADCNHIICDCGIEYENGAVVRTSFVTSFGAPNVIESAPELTRLINKKMAEIRKNKRHAPPKYAYPDELVTAAMVQRYARHGIQFSVSRDECLFVRTLDAQKKFGKGIYGGGFLLSEHKAEEKAAAEASAQESPSDEADDKTTWTLSMRERALIRALGRRDRRTNF